MTWAWKVFGTNVSQLEFLRDPQRVKAIIIEGISNIMIASKNVASVFGIFEGRTNCNSTLAVHDEGDGRRRGLLCKIFQNHVGMSGGHDSNAGLVVFSLSRAKSHRIR
jgi:hypothetical protein